MTPNYEWQNLSSYAGISWYTLEEGEAIMATADPVIRKFIGEQMETIRKSTIERDGSQAYVKMWIMVQEELDGRIWVSSGSKYMYGEKIKILIPMVICRAANETAWIKSGIIKPIRLHGTLTPAYKRLPDLEFNPAEASPGAAITRYIRSNSI